MAERTRIQTTREADAVVGRVRVTAKDRPELLEAIANSPDGQKMLREGRRRIKQFEALDREAEEIAGTPDKRRNLAGRLRQINNERYPQLAMFAQQLGDANRHNSPEHIGKLLNDDREGLRFLRENDVGPDNDERIPGVGRTRGQLLVKLEGLEAEAAKGHKYQERLQAARDRISELELSGPPINITAELTKLVKDLGAPPFPCCPPITIQVQRHETIEKAKH